MVARDTVTEESGVSRVRPDETPIRGLVLVWAGGRAVFRPLVLDRGLTLGRDSSDLLGCDDARMSRRHCSVAYTRGAWQIDDLGSRNGTFVDGERVAGTVRVDRFRVLRIGHCLLLPAEDLRGWDGGVEVTAAGVIGPKLRAVREVIAAAARVSSTLLVTGTSGAGKELAARHFHGSGPGAGGPFVAVNCATIPEGLAERVLFGTVRGAYSGAQADADGFVQAADRGVFFLDEIAELDLEVQAKLLRFIETREACAIGATQARVIDVRLCFATHRDLREMARKGRFREDLYFRISQPQVTIPPLAARPEEIPWLVARTFAEQDRGPTPHPQLVETCLLREWPGNVRELMTSLRAAIQRATVAHQSTIEAEALDPGAGRAFAQAPAGPSQVSQASHASVAEDRLGDDEAVGAALRESHGNVMQAARALGVHRNQLRRWLLARSLDPKTFGEATE